jgi:hypothetical protein
VYDYDSNYIHAGAMLTRTGPSIIAAFKRAFKLLEARGCTPLLQRLDNKASRVLQIYMSEADFDFQLAPPHIHRRTVAERATRTFNNHFISRISSTNTNFMLNLWEKLLPQGLLTPNLPRRSRINHQLSVQAQVQGAFDYSRTPLAPPGIDVLSH